MVSKRTLYAALVSLAVVLALSIGAATGFAQGTTASGTWIAGDFHTHTWLTDGKHTEQEVVANAFDKYGLDWMANSEHGGAGSGMDTTGKWLDSYDAKLPISGTPITVTETTTDKKTVVHTSLWRWQSLRDLSWPTLFGGKDLFGQPQTGLQSKYDKKVLIQGLEWNVPTHEHASIGIINQKDATEISNVEYRFDGSDKDTSQPSLAKTNSTHQDAVKAVAYLQERFPKTSYMIVNHPSRSQAFTAADLRDLNNAAPDVAIGLEGMPGHQKEPARGGYDRQYFTDAEKKNLDQAKTNRARTYGGADWMLAQVGGVMDSLWGEGRRFWVFVNSDFHSSADNADFWPGEYARTYTKVKDLSPTGIVDGMRSGNVFIVHGDLINALDFQAASGGTRATMGEELTVKQGSDVSVSIRFKSPDKNNNGDQPVVDHIDLIVGDVTGKIVSTDPNYKSETNPSTRVIATFTNKDWKTDADGYYNVSYTLPGLRYNEYLRLRGTNLAKGVENQTDQDGNPLNDDLVGANDKAKAWADLWFYSNPIFLSTGSSRASITGTVQFVYTSDAHYGITRSSFQGAKNVDGHAVNAALVAAINKLPGETLPCLDGGVNACKPVGSVDYVIETGDIANRSEVLSATLGTYIQPAAASWAQFEADYIKGLQAKDKNGNPSALYLVPGNHDVSNAIGFVKPISPTADATSLAQIYNLMLKPATPKSKDTYNYATDRVYYSKDLGCVHGEFISMWPDGAARAWMENDLKNVSPTTPVVIFTHDQPDAESKHFVNPNGSNDINSKDLFEDLLSDKFADSTKVNDDAGNPVPSVIEQRALVAFLKQHPNIVAYFHGNSNYNQYYTYQGPESDIALRTFRVDSPMKGDVSSKDESKLSFQVGAIDCRTLNMSVREYLWNAKTWGASMIISLAPPAH